MKPKDILHEEQKLFSAKQKEYAEKYSERDEEGNIINAAIMPHKGYNFSMSYDAFENAMERYAKQEIDKIQAKKFSNNHYGSSNIKRARNIKQ